MQRRLDSALFFRYPAAVVRLLPAAMGLFWTEKCQC